MQLVDAVQKGVGRLHCSLSVALLKRKPIAMILIVASRVNNTVKQLSRYPTKTIIEDSGSESGLSMTKVIELMTINDMMTPSKILAATFFFCFGCFFIETPLASPGPGACL